MFVSNPFGLPIVAGAYVLFIASYAYTTPEKIATTPYPGHEPSSPSTRISLRRMSNRPCDLTLPKMLQSDFNDELLFNIPLKWQNNTNTAMTHSEPHLTDKPPNIQGIQLISPHELPDRFRQVFPYKLFNAVQSKCFALIYKTNNNIVVAAPTGSGKTAILELAICKLIQEFGSEQFKIVYQAPTKSLCSERVRDWERKFSHLNLPCAELTGDTDNSEMRKVGNAAIIVTTPEKWDSITRKWKDHVKLLQLVKLVLIDEVHILKDPRGATLEAVVSRMKSICTNVRFVALSATVPNSEDIAMWLGRDHTNGHLPAHRETFGEEFRPVKLQKHVYGFSANINDFAFDSFLDTKLPGLIAKHTIRKPVMVFCVTRKICESTAAKLAEWWSSLRVTERPWPIPPQKVTVGSPELRELVGCGVAFHHAGLDAQDRIAVETGFLRDGLSVICCTSTLAVGVNLPCHLVVIKNTVCYKDDGLSEYSDLEVMQILGRAGRPQFDDSATAIIMTRSEKVDRYKLMISGQDILESTLHLNLIEHLNSEIGLGTVNDVYSAKRWLAGTFLSVRMRQNPTYYKFSCDTGSRDADERLEGVCERDIELLKNNKLITEDQRFTCTEYGQAMSKYMVQFETMKLLLSIPKNAKMTQIVSSTFASI
jgi:ATP-dependent DNA helicase HFM1/MER3